MSILRVLSAFLLVGASPSTGHASDTGGARVPVAQDPMLVLTRTVHPRTAYHALPPRENPVSAAASVFPSRVFHATIAAATAPVGDLLLGDTSGDRAMAGDATTGLEAIGRGVPQVLGAGSRASGGVPIGPGASVAGAVTGATSGLAGLIHGAVGPRANGGGP